MIGVVLPIVVHFCIWNLLQMMSLHFDAGSLITLSALAALPVFLYMYREDCMKREEGWGIRLLGVREALELSVLALACNVVLTLPITKAADFFHFSNAAQEELYASDPFWIITGTVIFVPIMEEVLFRGLVYRRWKAYNEGWFAVIGAAAAFALYHGNLIQILFAFPMAVVIIRIYDRCGTILAPIWFHMIVNLSSVLVQLGVIRIPWN